MAMASLFHAPTSISPSLYKPKIISSALRIPGYLKKPLIIVPKRLPSFDKKKVAIDEFNRMTTITNVPNKEDKEDGSIITLKLYTLLEVINDRIEMHQNVKEQRDNWNSMLLNSLNMITLTAATMVGLAGADETGHSLGLNASSTFLFAAATGILLIMNKIQPSQLVQEQRNAVRLFKKLQTKIQTSLSLQTSTKREVEYAMEEVLALDRAYPLPLLGTMLEKFPKKFESAKWWPSLKRLTSPRRGSKTNGWSVELEEDMREIVGVIKNKDIQDYGRLGNKALMFNKILAMLGPSLMGIATIGSALSGHAGPWAGLVAALAGSMATVVNTIEHGGQVGMVFEMYRNCAGLFTLLGEMAESNLEESDLGKRENGELFEMKVALYLGRNLNELRDLADKSRTNGGDVDGFASKLF